MSVRSLWHLCFPNTFCWNLSLSMEFASKNWVAILTVEFEEICKLISWSCFGAAMLLSKDYSDTINETVLYTMSYSINVKKLSCRHFKSFCCFLDRLGTTRQAFLFKRKFYLNYSYISKQYKYLFVCSLILPYAIVYVVVYTQGGLYSLLESWIKIDLFYLSVSFSPSIRLSLPYQAYLPIKKTLLSVVTILSFWTG